MSFVKRNRSPQSSYYALVLTATLLLPACATQQSPEPAATDTPAIAPQAAEVQGPDPDIVEQYGGDGMKMPLDGSSLEAFEASLEKVRRNTSSTRYETLSNAIDYLLVYDLAARRDRERLAARLDGLNGYEVIEKVGWQKP